MALKNPYCTVAQVRSEIRNQDSAILTQIEDAINQASRFIDDYKGRDYFYRNRILDPLIIDEHDAVYGDQLYPKFRPILSVTELKEGDTVLVEDTDFVVKGTDDETPSCIYRIGGEWAPHRPDNLISLKAEFGYRQTATWPVTEAGDAANQMSNWSLQELGSDVVYWGIVSTGGSNVRVDLWSDSAHSNRIATGTGTTSSTVTLAQDNSSGVSGSVVVAYTIDDVDAANTLTPTAVTVADTEVPQDLPGYITRACILIAAALSGHNVKEVVGLEGNKETVIDKAIPKTALTLLGSRKLII